MSSHNRKINSHTLRNKKEFSNTLHNIIIDRMVNIILSPPHPEVHINTNNEPNQTNINLEQQLDEVTNRINNIQIENNNTILSIHMQDNNTLTRIEEGQSSPRDISLI